VKGTKKEEKQKNHSLRNQGPCHVNHHLFILKRRNGKKGAKRTFEITMAENMFDGRH
jgi:hypothetical protein